MHSHLPDATKEGGALKGYSVGDRTKREANFARLNSLMAQYRLDFGVNDLDITTSGRTLLVTLLHLFLNLPCLIPKTKIEFRGYLGLPMMKSIELKNPSKKKICYAVTLAGSKDFTIGSHDLVIPAGGAIDYPVTMNARFAESSTGVITFTGVREAGVAGATMVFGLESFIVGRKPVSVVKKACSVFELEQFVIDVKNPFDRDMNFSIKIMSSHSSMKIADAVAGKPCLQPPDLGYTIPWWKFPSSSNLSRRARKVARRSTKTMIESWKKCTRTRSGARRSRCRYLAAAHAHSHLTFFPHARHLLLPRHLHGQEFRRVLLRGGGGGRPPLAQRLLRVQR